MADDLTLTVGGRNISGWTSIRITRGVERLPSDFEIGMTELNPGDLSAVVVHPGEPCVVRLGNDVVVTGYVDRYVPAISAGRHDIQVVGRGKCEDLVDCSAEWPSNQISSATILGIARKLAAPYGITVSAIGDVVGDPIPQLNLNWGETPHEVIDRICRYRALLNYEGPDGNLILARVGSETHASGFTQGQNVERASIAYSMDQRFNEYVVRRLSFDMLSELGDAADILERVPDPLVPSYRHRKRYIIAESGDAGLEVAKMRGHWEASRRAGRAYAVHLTADSWRDSAGRLWTPNMLVPLSLPSLKLDRQTWVIGDVTYRRDERGTTADLVIMPPGAYEPQPLALTSTLADIPARPAR